MSQSIRQITQTAPRTALVLLSGLLFVAGCTTDSTGPGSSITLASSRGPIAGEWTLLTVNGKSPSVSDTLYVDDTSRAFVDQDGRLFARSAGRVRVMAKHWDAVDTLSLTIAAAPADRFPVTYEFVGFAPTPAVRMAFERAAIRLQSVLREKDAPVDVDLSESGCLVQHGILPTHVGLTIQVEMAETGYDDGTGADIGLGAPCYQSKESGRAKVAAMHLSTKRLAGYQSAGTWAAYRELELVVLHESAHGLGLVGQSNAWIVDWAPMDSTESGERQWLGSTAMSAYSSMGGSGPVPLTQDWSHWKTSVGDDVMQSMAIPENRLSSLSVGALLDLGYGARMEMAEPLVRMVHPRRRVE